MAKEYPLRVDWRAFELHPEISPEGEPRPDSAYMHAGGQASQRLAAEAGLVMRRPPFRTNSRRALESAEYAREHGRFDDYHLALFKAYWEDNLNIGQIPVLRQVAERVGLDPDGLEAALCDGRYAQAVEADLEESRQLGITGVPAFIIGRYLVVGAQPYSVFKRAAELALADRDQPTAD